MVRAVKVGIDFDDLYKGDVYVNDLKTEVRDIFPHEASLSLVKAESLKALQK